MKITPIRTPRITSRSTTLLDLLDAVLDYLPERSVLAITSKIVSLCEGRTVPVSEVPDKDALIRHESDWYLPSSINKYDITFSITQNTLIPGAGIDKSNAEDCYVLWPHDPQTTANMVRQYLKERFKLNLVGVILTDSTSRPLRWGTSGIALAYSGFVGLKDYRGTKDLFGREFIFETMDVAGGLAAAAVVNMGEGAEQTPLAVIEDATNIDFQEHDPSEEELGGLNIAVEDDIYAPLLKSVKWLRGDKASGETIL